jgi:hypothetical protein
LEKLLTSLDAGPKTSSDCQKALELEDLERQRIKDDPSLAHFPSPVLTLDEWMEQHRQFRRYVHAELQIVIYFRNRKFEYADERFIGCSKRACYVCYHFLKWYGELFPDQAFVLPGKHSKIIHMVKVPWISSNENQTLFMMDKLNRQLARHIEEALLKRVPLKERLESRHLSTDDSTNARDHVPQDRRKSTNSPHLFQLCMVNNTVLEFFAHL